MFLHIYMEFCDWSVRAIQRDSPLYVTSGRSGHETRSKVHGSSETAEQRFIDTQFKFTAPKRKGMLRHLRACGGDLALRR